MEVFVVLRSVWRGEPETGLELLEEPFRRADETAPITASVVLMRCWGNRANEGDRVLGVERTSGVAFAVAGAGAGAASMVGGLAAIVFVAPYTQDVSFFLCVFAKRGGVSLCVCGCTLPQQKGKCQEDIGLLGAWPG